MTIYDCEAVFQSATELPKDRFINTFHFVGLTAVSPGDSTEMECAAARIAQFYTKQYPVDPDHPALTAAISDYLSAEIDRTVTVNVYDHLQAKPRTPYPFHFALTAAGGAQSLPEEVALCASYYSARNVARQRGRLYIGPFNTSALGGPTTVTSRPTPNLIAAIAAAAKDLALVEDGVVDISNVLTDGLFIAGLFGLPGAPGQPSFLDPATSFPPMKRVNWLQHSVVGDGTMPTKKDPGLPASPREVFGLVSGGWVDNEWDGQRRRRIEASARTTWIA
jgi:hypothetical protein